MTDAARAIARLMDRSGQVVTRFARPIRDGLILIPVGLTRAVWTFIGVDARAYWNVNLGHPYVGSGVGDVSTDLYSPAFAQLTAPLSILPFPVFDALWTVLLIATFVWLVRPWPWAAYGVSGLVPSSLLFTTWSIIPRSPGLGSASHGPG